MGAGSTERKSFIKVYSKKDKNEIERVKQKIKEKEKSKGLRDKKRDYNSTGVDMNTLIASADDIASNYEDNAISLRAESLIDQIVNGGLTLGNLSLENKCDIFCHLGKYGVRMGRILDIHTRLPMSSIRLERPKHRYALISDYVMHFFEKIYNSYEFKLALTELIHNYWLYSFGAVLIEDDYAILNTDSTIKGKNPYKHFDKLMTKPESDGSEFKYKQEELDAIDKKYRKNKESVDFKEKNAIIKQVLAPHCEKYKGPIRFTVLHYSQVLTRLSNRDIDFHTYTLPVSSSIIKIVKAYIDEITDTDTETYNNTKFVEAVTDLGYSQSMAEIAKEFKKDASGVTFDVTSDPFSELGMYVCSFEKPGMSKELDNSLFNRVLDDAINLQVANKRIRDKANKGYKKDIIVSADEKSSEESLVELDEAIQSATENQEGSIILTNVNISSQELDLNAGANADLSELKETSEKNIAEGLGVPENLISDSTDAYANSFLKTVILETEYIEFKEAIKMFLERKVFEPIAIKMGFLVTNEWGEPEPIYPKIKFNRMSLARGSDDFQQMIELAQSNKLPYSYILEILGVDPDEAKSGLRKEATTILSEEARGVLTSQLEGYSQSAAESEVVKDELSDNLDLVKKDMEFKEFDAGMGAEGGAEGE